MVLWSHSTDWTRPFPCRRITSSSSFLRSSPPGRGSMRCWCWRFCYLLRRLPMSSICGKGQCWRTVWIAVVLRSVMLFRWWQGSIMIVVLEVNDSAIVCLSKSVVEHIGFRLWWSLLWPIRIFARLWLMYCPLPEVVMMLFIDMENPLWWGRNTLTKMFSGFWIGRKMRWLSMSADIGSMQRLRRILYLWIMISLWKSMILSVMRIGF